MTRAARCRMCHALVAAILLALVPAVPQALLAGGQRAASAQSAPAKQTQKTPKPKKTPAAKMAEPWPDEATIASRREDAEARRLFQKAETLPVTLTADFGAVNGDRNPASTKTFPGTLTVAGDAGTDVSMPIALRTRGRLRLDPRVCTFAPLRVDFAKKAADGTPFDEQRTLKLVTHCQDFGTYDQFILKEYLAYRLYNLVTPKSFRVRLAKVNYVNSKNGKTLFTHYGVFVEDDDDLARRLDGRAIEFPHTAFKNYDTDAMTTMMVFQYMIGNTDFSLWGLHNAKQVQTRFRPLYPIVWDFDASGLVFPPYVMPDPRLQLASLQDRKYRGPCRTVAAIEPILQAFRAKQAESLALVDSVPDLTEAHRKDVKKFLGGFYDTLGRPDRVKREFVDNCNKENNTI